MKNQTKGFTLVELMIVVAIIGILAAIAVPAYQDYITRSQASEPVELLAGLKHPLMEFRNDRGHWPSNIGQVGSGASVEGILMGKYAQVSNIVGGAGTSGLLTVTATVSIGNAKGTTITMTSVDGTAWDCNGGTLPTRYRPAGCK